MLGVLPLLLTVGCLDDAALDIDWCSSLPEPCVNADHPLEFYDHWLVVADEGVAPLELLAIDELVFTVTSSDPAVLEVVRTPSGEVELHGHARGDVEVIAFDADGGRLDRAQVMVRPVAAVEFRFDPAGGDRLAELAALPGATERIRVLAFDEAGSELRGAEPAISFAVTGPMAVAPLVSAESRPSQIYGVLPVARPPGFVTAVRFDALGSGALSARVDGVEVGALPIEIIPTATDVQLVKDGDAATVNWYAIAGLVGTDSRGVPVAGLIGDFTASPAELVRFDDPHAGVAILRTLAVGTVTVTATLPDRVLTTTIEIVP